MLKLFVFSTQYRNPLEYSEQAMQDAGTGLSRLYECVAHFHTLDQNEDPSAVSVISDKERSKLTSLEQRFCQAMDNDFNSAQAIGHLFDAAKIINKIIGKLAVSQSTDDLQLLESSVKKLVELAQIMGILTMDSQEFLAQQKQSILDGLEIDEETINQLIAKRFAARQEKNWQLSDQIRDQLLGHSIELKDGPDGTRWSVKKE